MIMNRNTVAIICMTVLAGCARTYEGPGVENLPPSSLAVIDIDLPLDDPQLPILQEVDGKWRGVGILRRYELVPGPHTISFIYAYWFKRSTIAIVDSFRAEAGHTYHIRANADAQRMIWKPEIIDTATGAVVSTQVGTTAAD